MLGVTLVSLWKYFLPLTLSVMFVWFVYEVSVTLSAFSPAFTVMVVSAGGAMVIVPASTPCLAPVAVTSPPEMVMLLA